MSDKNEVQNVLSAEAEAEGSNLYRQTASARQNIGMFVLVNGVEASKRPGFSVDDWSKAANAQLKRKVGPLVAAKAGNAWKQRWNDGKTCLVAYLDPTHPAHRLAVAMFNGEKVEDAAKKMRPVTVSMIVEYKKTAEQKAADKAEAERELSPEEQAERIGDAKVEFARRILAALKDAAAAGVSVPEAIELFTATVESLTTATTTV